MLGNRTPMGFHGTALQIGKGFVSNGGITCGLNTRRLSIHVSASANDKAGAGWYDIELENIERLAFEGIFGTEPDQQTNIVLHLVDFREQDFLFMYNMERRNDATAFRIRIFLDESAVISNEIQAARNECRRRIDPAGFVMKISQPEHAILSIEPGMMSQEEAEEMQNMRREETMKDVASTPLQMHQEELGEEDAPFMVTQDSMLEAAVHEYDNRKESKVTRPSTRSSKSAGLFAKLTPVEKIKEKSPLAKAGTGNKLKDRMTFPVNANERKQFDASQVDPSAFPDIPSADEEEDEEEEEVPKQVPVQKKPKQDSPKKTFAKRPVKKGQPKEVLKKAPSKKDPPQEPPKRETPKVDIHKKDLPMKEAPKKEPPKKKAAPPPKKSEPKDPAPSSEGDIYDYPESDDDLEIPAKSALKGAKEKLAAAPKSKRTAARAPKKAPVKTAKTVMKPVATMTASKKKVEALKEGSISTALVQKDKPHLDNQITHNDTDPPAPDSPEAVFTKKTVIKTQTIKTTTTTVTKNSSQSQQTSMQPTGKKRALQKTSQLDFQLESSDERATKRKKPLESPPPTGIRRSARIKKNPTKMVVDEESEDSELSDVPSPKLLPTMMITPKTGVKVKKGKGDMEDLRLPKPVFEMSTATKSVQPAPQQEMVAPEALMMEKNVGQKQGQQEETQHKTVTFATTTKEPELLQTGQKNVGDEDLPMSSVDVPITEPVKPVTVMNVVATVPIPASELLRTPEGKGANLNMGMISPLSVPIQSILQLPDEKKKETMGKPTVVPKVVRKAVEKATEKKPEPRVESASEKQPVRSPAKEKTVPHEKKQTEPLKLPVTKKAAEKAIEKQPEPIFKPVVEKQTIKTTAKEKSVVQQEKEEVMKTGFSKQQKPVQSKPIVEENVDTPVVLEEPSNTNNLQEKSEPFNENTMIMVHYTPVKPVQKVPQTPIRTETQQSLASQIIEVEQIPFSQLNSNNQESAKKVLTAANLQRKPQIIQWGKNGPKNQGEVRLEAKSDSPLKKTVIVPPAKAIKAAVQASVAPKELEKVVPKKREAESPTRTESQAERMTKRAKRPLLEIEEEEDEESGEEDLYPVLKSKMVKPKVETKVEKQVVKPEILKALQENPEAFKTPHRRVTVGFSSVYNWCCGY